MPVLNERGQLLLSLSDIDKLLTKIELPKEWKTKVLDEIWELLDQAHYIDGGED